VHKNENKQTFRSLERVKGTTKVTMKKEEKFSQESLFTILGVKLNLI